MTTRTRRTRWWIWVALIGASGLLAVLLTGFTQGACYDSSDPALSYCESGPVIGVAGVWIIWTAWAALVVIAIVRMLRTRP